MSSILSRLSKAAVAPSRKKAVIFIHQSQTDKHALDSGMYVIVSHLVMRSHFRASSCRLKIRKVRFAVLQMVCSPAIVVPKRGTVFGDSRRICFIDLLHPASG